MYVYTQTSPIGRLWGGGVGGGVCKCSPSADFKLPAQESSDAPMTKVYIYIYKCVCLCK